MSLNINLNKLLNNAVKSNNGRFKNIKTKNQAAIHYGKLYNVSSTTILRWAKKGQLPDNRKHIQKKVIDLNYLISNKNRKKKYGVRLSRDVKKVKRLSKKSGMFDFAKYVNDEVDIPEGGLTRELLMREMPPNFSIAQPTMQCEIKFYGIKDDDDDDGVELNQYSLSNNRSLWETIDSWIEVFNEKQLEDRYKVKKINGIIEATAYWVIGKWFSGIPMVVV
jgi:hypothetical protein